MITRHTQKLIDLALSEDLDGGDITTRATIPEGGVSQAVVMAKEPLVLAGLPVFEEVFKRLGGGRGEVEFTANRKDGEAIEGGESIAGLSGPSDILLMGERTALNFLMRLSGIATLTSQCVGKIEGSGVRITDTRKTTPGWRYLEKYAVRMGGGHNHRFSLADGVLIKDNHIAASGGIRDAVVLARENAPHTSRIEVEVRDSKEITQAIDAGADILLLDNMSPRQVKDAVELIDGRVMIEVSGGITLKNVSEYAIKGVDFISMGYLTHHAVSVDISITF